MGCVYKDRAMQIGVETSRAVENKRVFVVDDDDITRAVPQFMLQDDNETHDFPTLADAYAKGERGHPDLLLLGLSVVETQGPSRDQRDRRAVARHADLAHCRVPPGSRGATTSAGRRAWCAGQTLYRRGRSSQGGHSAWSHRAIADPTSTRTIRRQMTDLLPKPLTNYSRIGGQAEVGRLVEAFYQRMDLLPDASGIRAMHQVDLASTKAVLKRYLVEWLGGPPLYSVERGHPRLRMRHIQLRIGPDERDAWMLCMSGALDEVVADAALRQMLHDAFLKLADWVRNDPENPHDRR
jgi:hemoglobin